MSLIFLVFHLVVAASLVGLVLMQRSEGGALGAGGGSSSMISGRGAADFLARLTMGVAAVFFITSLTLTWLARDRDRAASVVDVEAVEQSETGVLAPATSGPVAPSADQAVQRAGPLEREPPVEPSAPSPAAPRRQAGPDVAPAETFRAPLIPPQTAPAAEQPAGEAPQGAPAAPGGPEE